MSLNYTALSAISLLGFIGSTFSLQFPHQSGVLYHNLTSESGGSFQGSPGLVFDAHDKETAQKGADVWEKHQKQMRVKSYRNAGLKHLSIIDLRISDDNSVSGTYSISEYSEHAETYRFRGTLKGNQLEVVFLDGSLPYQTDPEDLNSNSGVATWRIKRYADGRESRAIQTYGRNYTYAEPTWDEYIMEFEEVKGE